MKSRPPRRLVVVQHSQACLQFFLRNVSVVVVVSYYHRGISWLARRKAGALPCRAPDVANRSDPISLCTPNFCDAVQEGPAENVGNYRAIGLICHGYKLLSMLVLHRMQDAVESRLSETHADFRENVAIATTFCCCDC